MPSSPVPSAQTHELPDTICSACSDWPCHAASGSWTLVYAAGTEQCKCWADNQRPLGVQAATPRPSSPAPKACSQHQPASSQLPQASNAPEASAGQAEASPFSQSAQLDFRKGSSSSRAGKLPPLDALICFAFAGLPALDSPDDCAGSGSSRSQSLAASSSNSRPAGEGVEGMRHVASSALGLGKGASDALNRLYQVCCSCCWYM